MPNLDKQILKGRERYLQGFKRYMDKVPLRQATAMGVATYFSQVFKQNDWGEPPLLTKKTIQMLGSFIRMALREGRDSGWVFNIIASMVESWEYLRGCEFVTQNGKAWIIGPRPSLKDLVTCSGSMISHITDIEDIRFADKDIEVPVERTPQTQKVAVPIVQRSGLAPSQEEMDEDFRRIQEDE